MGTPWGGETRIIKSFNHPSESSLRRMRGVKQIMYGRWEDHETLTHASGLGNDNLKLVREQIVFILESATRIRVTAIVLRVLFTDMLGIFKRCGETDYFGERDFSRLRYLVSRWLCARLKLMFRFIYIIVCVANWCNLELLNCVSARMKKFAKEKRVKFSNRKGWLDIRQSSSGMSAMGSFKPGIFANPLTIIM